MDLLQYLIGDTMEDEVEIAPAEERNRFASITDPAARERKIAEARKRYAATHRTVKPARTLANQNKSKGAMNSNES